MSDHQPGDAGACLTFDELVATYESKLFNTVYRILGDYDEAADVTQEAFISAYRGFGRFRGDAKVYTWLYQIAVNHCRNRLRKRARTAHVESLDQERETDGDGQAPKLEIADLTLAPETVLQSQELRERILCAVQSLPADYREVVVLREIQGLTYNEIAEATQQSLDNVKTRLSRARAMLRRKLEPYYREG